MIGWLSGEVVARSGSVVILSVHGVGYEIAVAGDVTHLSVGATADLYIHTHVRDDALVLFGFRDEADRAIFRLLLSTPGIGPTTALGALSHLSGDELIRAIDEEDVSAISKIPGIGKKTASRLILELAGKLVRPAEVAPAARLATDVELALRGLGYGVTEIRSALEGIELPDDESAALKLALKYLGEK